MFKSNARVTARSMGKEETDCLRILQEEQPFLLKLRYAVCIM